MNSRTAASSRIETKERLATRLNRINEERAEKRKLCQKALAALFVYGLILILLEAYI